MTVDPRDQEALREALTGRFEWLQPLEPEDGLIRALVRDPALGRVLEVVALPPSDDTPERRAELLAAASLIGRVHDEHVRLVYHPVTSSDGAPRFAVEHLDGERLDRTLARGPLPADDAIRLGRDLLSGLESLHAQGVALRHLEPAQVIRQPDRAVLTGFRVVELDELRRGADVTAAAALVYQAVTGRPWNPREPVRWPALPRRVRLPLQAILAPPDGAAAPDAATASAGFTIPETDWSWRHLARWGIVAAAVVVAVLWLFPPRPSLPTADLAILPFESVGGTPGDSLGVVMAELLRQALVTVPHLRLLPARETARWWERQGGTGVAFLDNAARSLGTRWVVHGLVSRSGREVRIRLLVYGQDRGETSLGEERSGVGELVGLSRRIALRLQRTTAPELEAPMAPVGLDSIPYSALIEFLQGEVAFERDAWTQAQRHYESAIATDSSFALAWWRLANVRRWRRVATDFTGDLRAIQTRFGPDLSPDDREVVEALLEPAIASRLSRLEALVRRSPGDVYLRHLYAEELFHRGPLIGRSMDLALRAMGETLEQDSSFAEAYNHLFLAAVRSGRRADARRYLALRRRVSVKVWPGDPDVVGLMQLAYDARFLPWKARLKLWALEHWGDSVTLDGAAHVSRVGAPWFDLAGTQIALSGILLRRGPATDSARASAHTGIGLGLLQLGRPVAGLAELDTAASLAPSREALLQQAEWRVVPPLLGVPGFTTPVDSVWWARLAQQAEDTAVAGRARWALGLAALVAGDSIEFERQRHLLETADPGAPLAALLRAVAAGARGHPGEALAISDSVRAILSVDQPPDPFAGVVFHLLRGDWYAALGDTLTADTEWRWYEGSDFVGWPAAVPQAAEVEATFNPVARYRRAVARLTSTGGPPDRSGCAMLRRVLDLWSEAEPAMGDLRRAAAERARSCP